MVRDNDSDDSDDCDHAKSEEKALANEMERKKEQENEEQQSYSLDAADMLERFGQTKGSQIGFARTYTFPDGATIVISQVYHYFWRDPRLYGINYTEFEAMFAVRKMTANDKTWFNAQNEEHGDDSTSGVLKPKAGRPVDRFLFLPRHPLATTHLIVKVCKYNVLAFAGRAPPALPKHFYDDETTLKASQIKQNVTFARFFVANYIPWSPLQPPVLTVLRWKSHIEDLTKTAYIMDVPEDADDDANTTRHIANGRLFKINNVTKGFTVHARVQALSMRHRNRSRTLWAQEHAPPQEEVYQKSSAYCKAAADLQRAREETQLLAPDKILNRLKTSTQFHSWNDSLEELLPTGRQQSAEGVSEPGEMLKSSWRGASNPDHRCDVDYNVEEAAKDNRKPLPAAPQSPQLERDEELRFNPESWKTNTASTPEALTAITESEYQKLAAAYTEKKKVQENGGDNAGHPPLNLDQRSICRHYLKVVEIRHKGKIMGKSPDQINDAIVAAGLTQTCLLYGAGGTGKSAVIHELKRQMKRLGYGKLLVTGFTGVSAAPFGGPTLLRVCNLGRNISEVVFLNMFSPKKKHDSTERFLEDAGVSIHDIGGLVIDEVSFISMRVLGHAHNCLRQLMGELNLFCGGLPVILAGDNHQKQPIGNPSFYTDMVKHTIDQSLGPYFFGVRSANVAGYLWLLSARRYELKKIMRAEGDPAFIQAQLLIRDTSISKPVTIDFVRSIPPVTKRDLRQDETWQFAPIGVLSQIERDSINVAQLYNFAKAFDLPLVKWKLPLSERKYDSLHEDVRDELYDNEINLWGYFVEGAPALLTENIKSVRKLVNGTTGLLHSLEFNGDVPDDLVTALSIGTYTEVTLLHPPHAVNVRVGNCAGELPYLWHGVPLEDLSDLISTVIQGSQTIPLVRSTNVQSVKLYSTFSVQNAMPDQVLVRNFNYMLAFAMTDYKLQGRTLPKLIISIPPSYRRPPMTLVSFYVLISRVQTKNGLRLLSHDINAMFALTKRSHDPYLHAYEHAYDTNGMWSDALALAAVPTQLKQLYKRRKEKRKKIKVKAAQHNDAASIASASNVAKKCGPEVELKDSQHDAKARDDQPSRHINKRRCIGSLAGRKRIIFSVAVDHDHNAAPLQRKRMILSPSTMPIQSIKTTSPSLNPTILTAQCASTTSTPSTSKPRTYVRVTRSMTRTSTSAPK